MKDNRTNIRNALLAARTQLASISDTSKLDATILLSTLLAKSRAWLMAHEDETLPPDIAKQFSSWITRRSHREPVAYLTGMQAFFGRDFAVTKDVLIPRPETELLVETVLGLLPDIACDVLDLGIGSGAIACTLAAERPNWHVVGTDISAAALRIAEKNAAAFALLNVTLLQSNWFEALPKSKRYHAIVSNPPYVEYAYRDHMPESLRYEPEGALFSGEAGLDDITRIVRKAPDYLRPKGILAIEHGYEQGASVRDLFAQARFQSIETKQDLAGKDRVTLGRYF